MKSILVPEDVICTDVITGERVKDATGQPQAPMRFVEFVVRNRLNDHKYFGTSPEALESRKAILDAFLRHKCEPKAPERSASAGDVVELHPNDYALLLAAVNAPSAPYLPEFMGQCLSFIRAVRDAKG